MWLPLGKFGVECQGTNLHLISNLANLFYGVVILWCEAWRDDKKLGTDGTKMVGDSCGGNVPGASEPHQTNAGIAAVKMHDHPG